MKDLPKLPMLYFESKFSPSAPDLTDPIKKFIRDCYGDDGELYNKEIKELESLRSIAIRTPHDMNGCSILKRYYAQLYTLYNKAKIVKGYIDAKFTWNDIYTGNTVVGDIQLELNCILFNIGALHAELGALDMRDNANLKVACTHFQCAVWAFEQLKENPHNFKSKDMSHDIISFIYHTMLAQAQECFLEKSIIDIGKSFIIAKVAAQVTEYYNNALVVLIQASLNADSNSITEVVGPKLFKEWKRFIEFKISFYSAVYALYMGNYCEEERKYGERIAWYLLGIDNLKQAEKSCKAIGRAETTDAFNYLNSLLSKRHDVAQKENDLVYHEVVPTSDKLTAVKGAALVTGIGFDVSDPEIAGRDIFARLVPIEAHEMASIYSDNKDRIMRDMRTKVNEKNAELAAYLSSLQLDKGNLRPTRHDIPDELVEICAELSVKPTICEDVKSLSTQLESLASEVSKSLEEISNLIKEEEEKEKRYQEKFGRRTPSLIMIELKKEFKKYQETHQRGLASNENLHQVLEKFSNDIRLLINCSTKDLENLLPPLSDIPYDEQNVREIEKLLDKVQEMKDQRAALEAQLREAIKNDDVLKQILAHSKEELEGIFQKELKKYDKTVNLLEQNMSAQENILNALTNASASYGNSRMALNEVNRLRASRIQSLISSYQGFLQVQTNIEKGNKFYKELRSSVGKLLARMRSVVKVQDEERVQFVEVQIKKETGLFNNLSIGPTRLPEPGATPKLKDFLPYMNYRNILPPSTGSLPSQPTANSRFPNPQPIIDPSSVFSQQQASYSSLPTATGSSYTMNQTPIHPYYQNGRDAGASNKSALSQQPYQMPSGMKLDTNIPSNYYSQNQQQQQPTPVPSFASAQPSQFVTSTQIPSNPNQIPPMSSHTQYPAYAYGQNNQYIQGPQCHPPQSSYQQGTHPTHPVSSILPQYSTTHHDQQSLSCHQPSQLQSQILSSQNQLHPHQQQNLYYDQNQQYNQNFYSQPQTQSNQMISRPITSTLNNTPTVNPTAYIQDWSGMNSQPLNQPISNHQMPTPLAPIPADSTPAVIANQIPSASMSQNFPNEQEKSKQEKVSATSVLQQPTEPARVSDPAQPEEGKDILCEFDPLWA
ncbi:tyrosine-protein phosphatase non-receptor type protein myopic [Brevipalpus obovatus]|uniref:tyrosine-protein phosphatase non-receptor type protein myopic n=1 Tax=Brevipalpus obovatus TaxID=246614 RepID=UPI003D9EBFF1